MTARQTFEAVRSSTFDSIREGSYEVKIAATRREVDEALRLRFTVFKKELGGSDEINGLEFDDLDLKCDHMIVKHVPTGDLVATYRVNTLELAGSVSGFYSAREFTIDTLPNEVLAEGVELGRACIAREHRNSRVLFLIWKGLLRYLLATDKRYFFGCCSIFTDDPADGVAAYRQLLKAGDVEAGYFVEPITNRVDMSGDDDGRAIKLPDLFNLYLKLGAKVCSSPMHDREFGTVDLFVVLDTKRADERYWRMFS